MNAGSLDEQIYFQTPVENNDGGSLTIDWNYVDVQVDPPNGNIAEWAHIISQKGGVAFAAAREESKSLIRVQIRYRDDFQTNWRVRWEGQFYNVVDVDRTQRRDGWLWFTAQITQAE